MIGRELDVLWSGQPDLRIEELGMARNGWERLGSCASRPLRREASSVFSITMVQSI